MNAADNMKHTMLRGECYTLLATCFYPPDREAFIRDGLIERLRHAMDHVCQPAAGILIKMGEALQQYSSEELSIEYAKLFVGPFRLKAPPYGSVYIDEGRRVMGDSTMGVISMYREAGLSIREDFKELPDHIGIELEFMSYLAFKEVESMQESCVSRAIMYGRKQKDFLKMFLFRWVPAFCNRLRESSDNDFYTLLAACVESFLSSEISHIDFHSGENSSTSSEEMQHVGENDS